MKDDMLRDEAVETNQPEETEKVTEEIKETIKETNEKVVDVPGPGKIFEFGDLYFSCGACGNYEKIGEGLQGISFTVPAAEHASVSFECSKCHTKMELVFEESSEEIKKLRQETLEQINEEDGSIKEDKERKSEPGAAIDAERDVRVDEETAGADESTDDIRPTVEATA